MIKNYFVDLKTYVSNFYEIKFVDELLCNINIENILGFEVNAYVKDIYEHYKTFNLVWFNEGKYWGEVNFVPYDNLENEHGELVEIMEDLYDTKEDVYDITQDIMNWYPIFYFDNGDAFCLDKRNGNIVLYEHEVYDSGKNLHGLRVAMSLNDLFEKWEKIHFADVYYWDEICNKEGIDVNSKLSQEYI